MIENLSDERTPGGEVLLPPADAELAIGMLTKSGIAVLGAEVVRRHPSGLETLRISDYEIDSSAAEWGQFVADNNSLARDFVVSAVTSPNERVILTTASEAELRHSRGGTALGKLGSNTESPTIHVRLLDEGTPVLRSVPAQLISPGIYRLLPTKDYDPDIETWEFPPGSLVHCVVQESAGERISVAERLISSQKTGDH